MSNFDIAVCFTESFLEGVMVTYRFTIEITTYAAIMSNSSGQIFLFLNFPELRWTAFEVGDTQQLVYSRQHFFPLKKQQKSAEKPKMWCGKKKRALCQGEKLVEI